MYLVSVIIPYYNRGHTLPRALDSVLAQTFKDFEIILVNDGSTDQSEKVVENYMQNHPEVSFNHLAQPNQGPAAARNNGVRNARGKYFAFLDSDDSWEPDKLEIQLGYMEEHQDIALTGTNYTIVKYRQWPRYPLDPPVLEADFQRMLFKIVFVATTVIVRREVFLRDNLWFQEGRRQGEDILLFLQILRKYRGVRISKPLSKVYKLDFGEEDCLTGDLSKLLACERENLKILVSENGQSDKKINVLQFGVLYHFYLLKHFKRVVINKWNKRHKRAGIIRSL